MDRRPLVVVFALLALALVLPEIGVSPFGETGASAGPSASAPASPGAPASGGPSAAPGSASPGPSDGPAPSATPTTVFTDVAVVPVTQFRSTRTATTKKEVAAVLAGTSERYTALELVAADADAILAALGLDRPTDATHLIEASTAAKLTKDLAKDRDRLAFLRAAEVTPAVRALAWGDTTLFGVDRLTDATAWPLMASIETPSGDPAFDAASTWTVVAGGDIMLDRGVYDVLRNKGKGEAFPFDGGTADITGLVCCSSFGWKVPTLDRTGDKGAVRSLISDADVALANFENPAPNRFTYHTSGTIFSADQTLIDGIADAGFDVMGVANNHIRDQGADGLLQTVKNLKKRGLLTAGAGKNLSAARKPAIIETHGVKVAILAYDAIADSYHATAEKVGSAPLKLSLVKADIQRARAAGADVVIVFPHWGVEYRATAGSAQRKLARSIIDAGADMIIGNHAHWTVEMEVYKGKPIWYALGNLVFDQTWSAETMEGMTLELTFRGKTLAQIRMRPHVILDKSQPNFVSASDGQPIMERVYGGKNLPW